MTQSNSQDRNEVVLSSEAIDAIENSGGIAELGVTHSGYGAEILQSVSITGYGEVGIDGIIALLERLGVSVPQGFRGFLEDAVPELRGGVGGVYDANGGIYPRYEVGLEGFGHMFSGDTESGVRTGIRFRGASISVDAEGNINEEIINDWGFLEAVSISGRDDQGNEFSGISLEGTVLVADIEFSNMNRRDVDTGRSTTEILLSADVGRLADGGVEVALEFAQENGADIIGLAEGAGRIPEDFSTMALQAFQLITDNVSYEQEISEEQFSSSLQAIIQNFQWTYESAKDLLLASLRIEDPMFLDYEGFQNLNVDDFVSAMRDKVQEEDYYSSFEIEATALGVEEFLSIFSSESSDEDSGESIFTNSSVSVTDLDEDGEEVGGFTISSVSNETDGPSSFEVRDVGGDLQTTYIVYDPSVIGPYVDAGDLFLFSNDDPETTYIPGVSDPLTFDLDNFELYESDDFLDGRSLGDYGFLLSDNDYVVDFFTPSGQSFQIGDWTDGLLDTLDYASTFRSPLVLDLDGDGIELVHQDNGVFFDIDNDGFEEKVGWLGADDGHLARDINQNGVIDDITELFGDDVEGQTAYEKLTLLDSNSDGVIDEEDDAFDELLIWQDLNQDGDTNEGELESLEDAGIESISLNETSLEQFSQENYISGRSTYTKSDGLSGYMYDVHYLNDDMNSRFNGNAIGSLPIKLEALIMPHSRGYGEMPALHIAMTHNETLLDMVRELSSLPLGQFSEMNDRIEAILFEWAGVSDVAPDSRATADGTNIDARKMAFIEKFTGLPWLQLGVSGSVGVAASERLESVWGEIFNRISDRFLTQGPLRDLFPDVSYSFESDELSINTTISELMTRARTYINEVDDKPLFWLKLSNILFHQQEELEIGMSDINSAFEGVLGAGVSFDSGEWIQRGNDQANSISGTSSSDQIYGNGGNDTLYGHGREDSLYGGDGQDLIRGGDGVDRLEGGNGADTIYGGEGRDIIFGGFSGDEIYGGSGDDLLEGGYGRDTLDGGSGIDTVSYVTQATEFSNGYASVESVGVRINLETGVASHVDISEGGSVNLQRVSDLLRSIENIRGSFGHDTLTGDAGNNLINGEAGNDWDQGMIIFLEQLEMTH